ncbi:hypothetical protein [Pedococcus sp. P5_B7]
MPRRTQLLRGWAYLLPAVAVALAPLALTRPVGDPSPWLHLRVGQFLRQGGHFGLPDPWGPFATHAYVPTQWLPSVVVSDLTDRFGIGAVVWARDLGIVAVFAVVYLAVRALADLRISLVVTAAVMVAAWPALTERPQLLGFVLLAPVVALWQASARDGRARWSLVPLSWLLACTHGIWSLGLAVGAVCVIASPWARAGHRRMVGVWVASLAATALTPLGPRIMVTPFAAGSNGRQFVEEWLPSSARDPHVAVALGLGAVLTALWLFQPDRPSPWEVLLLLLSIALTLSMQRTVPVAALVLAPMVAAAGTVRWGSLDRERPTPRSERWTLLAGVVVAALLALPLSASAARHQPAYVPTGLQASLDALPAGTRVIAEGDVTGWMLYTAPQLRPVFDLRIESYSPEHVRDYIDARAAEPGWKSFVAKTQPRAALLLESSPLTGALLEESDWTERASDRGFVLLVAP